jgi:pyruvate dehydrogenase E1 component beta subunit
MGQDVDAPTAMFGSTRDLHEQFGPDRCWDTPLAETALMGIAVGAALGGRRPVYFHNRPDFLLLACDQLINHASKWYYMFGGQVNVPLVVWACIGRGWGSAAQHSQALQGLFMHVPGLKLIMPSFAADAKGLLSAAIADPNPVLILEHRFNFKNKGRVPEEMYRVPIGKGIVRREGAHVSIITISHMVHDALQAAESLSDQGIDAEVVDLRTLRPLDEEIILATAAKTGRVVLVDCGWRTCGITSEVAALLAEKGLEHLKAPVRRVTCPDLPTPAGYTLEAAFYPGVEQIVAASMEVAR